MNNDKYTDALERLLAEVSLLRMNLYDSADEPDGITADEIANILEIDKDIVYKDLEQLNKCQYRILGWADVDSEEWNVRDSRFTTLAFRLNEGELPIPLDNKEYAFLENFLGGELPKQKKPMIRIKNSATVKQFNEKLDDVVYRIQDIINHNNRMRIVYGEKIITVSPVTIEYRKELNRIYIIDRKNNSFRLDKIKIFLDHNGNCDFQKTIVEIEEQPKGKAAGQPDSSENSIAAGNVRKRSQKLKTIKIKIENLYSGLEDNIRRDLVNRPKDCLQKSEDGEYFIYEDKVQNPTDLLPWIYSYGSAMVVMEPASLRKRVIESYLRRKKYYESEE